MRWWKLGPLTDGELFRAKELIALTGLQLIREEFRVARMGPFRNAIFFPACGAPYQAIIGRWDLGVL